MAEDNALTSRRQRLNTIAQAPQTPVEFQVSDLDAKFLRFFHKQYFGPVHERDMIVIMGRGTLVPFYRLDISISSLLCRAALLVLSSYLHDWMPNINTFQYLSEFFVQPTKPSKLELCLNCYTHHTLWWCILVVV